MDTDVQTGDDGWEFAIVEIFGHRRHVGRVREEERFGTKMLRVDVPVKGEPETHGWKTHYYGGASIFSFSLTDEESVYRANRPPEPPSRYSLPPPSRRDDLEESEPDREAPF